jgi:methylenetetrahydrofolate dehydrogenase (NADP+)/methenyltetrahydrofolate cyclohydrolase
MTAQLIDGKALAARVRGEIATAAERLANDTGIRPGLSAVLVGDDPASATYVRMKGKACDEVGFESHIVRMPGTSTQDELLEQVAQLNADPEIHGILVQLPLPSQIDPDAITLAISPSKDVDGFHPTNVGRLVAGDLETGFVSATPAGIMKLIAEAGIDPVGREAVIVGRSDIVGKPTALLLMHAHATITVCHSRTPDLAAHTRRADILVAAVGSPNTVRGDMVKPGATVIDVGTNRVPRENGDGHRLVGDVDHASVADVAAWLTPVPGGVGPMTIAMLLANTLKAAERTAASSS